jgi:hypothetical protein
MTQRKGPAHHDQPSPNTTTEADTTKHNGHQLNGLSAALESGGGSRAALTVLAPQNDPFRVDSPSGHRDGEWLANTLDALGVTGQRHLRGLHYILIGQPKPNGLPYTNTDSDWKWLISAAKAARWNQYIPFDQIVDQRNDAPVIRKWSPPDPEPYVWVDFDVVVPGIDEITPLAGIEGFTENQPYHLVLVGEKSSLRPVLGAVAERYHADLYLPTGEISDTQAYMMARSAVGDGREMVVFYFSDCDPAGWQMPISLSRKLQGLKVIEFQQLDFQVNRVGLIPHQVREYGLPSTPLKDTELRADKWFEAFGVEQTEIDSLAALQPRLLRQIADEAISPFYDDTLSARVRQAMQEWQEEAQQVLDQHADEHLEALRQDAADRLAEKHNEIQEILESVRVNADELEFELPTAEVPEAQLDDEMVPDTALCDSIWSFAEQCRRLKASKDYDTDEISGW